MNREEIRIAIKSAVEDCIDIDARDIERAMREIDVAYMVAEAVDELLPDKLKDMLENDISDIVEEILDDALYS